MLLGLGVSLNYHMAQPSLLVPSCRNELAVVALGGGVVMVVPVGLPIHD